MKYQQEPDEDILVDANDPETMAIMNMSEPQLDAILRAYGCDVAALNIRLAADEAIAERLRQLERVALGDRLVAKPAWWSGQWGRACEPSRREHYGIRAKRAKSRAAQSGNELSSTDGDEPEECDRPWGVYTKNPIAAAPLASPKSWEDARVAVGCH